MFEKKRTSLYEVTPKVTKGCGATAPKFSNIFEREQYVSEHETSSGNGSYKLDTSGNDFVDDFAAISMYREPRSFSEVSKTMEKLWAIDSLLTMKLSVYIRNITRSTKLPNGEKLTVQRGQGLKAEFFMRMIWIATKHPDIFTKNLPVFVAAGSWDDLFEILRMDLEYNGPANKALPWRQIIKFIIGGLADEGQTNLVKKYLPQIKPSKKCNSLRSQCNNFIAKKIVKEIFDLGESEEGKWRAYKKYRELKASGNAHKWQQAISRQDYKNLDFDSIAGRALPILAKGKFLQNHGLEKAYEDWLSAKPVAKYTGFVYELFPETGYWGGAPDLKLYQKETINKQFAQLIETAKQDMNRETKLIAVLDTSGSMTSKANGLNVSAYHVAKSIGFYLSSLLEGPFANTVLEFSNTCKIKTWQGKTPFEKFYNYQGEGFCGTNLMSVAYKLTEMKKKGYKEEDFPTGIVCISDGEFNWLRGQESTFTAFRKELATVFSKEFVDKFIILLWDVPNGYYGKEKPTFEGLCDDAYTFYMSGLDPAGIAFLTGKTPVESIPKNALELFQAAMNQDLLNMLTL
nr:MAG TPA: protein of unknown function (DUF2828) [Caudoviricetes sp.]